MQLSADEPWEQTLIQSLLYIQTHLDGELDLDLLAERADFSPYHFHRLFRRFVGESLKAYIRRLRLERSAYRLKISDEPILHIALDAGFQTHETFTRAFKRQFGSTPSHFRQSFWQRRQTQREHLLKDRLPTTVGSDQRWRHDSGDQPVRLEHVKPLIVAFVRYVGPYQTLLAPGSPLASLWENLFTWGRTHGLVVPDTLLIGIPQDDPSVTPADKQRFDVCVQVPECRHPTGSIGCQTLAPGLYGVCRHYGSFDSLADTYRRIYTQCVLNDGYTLRTAPPFEVYGSSWLRNDLHIHYTDVYMPFEPRKDETYGRL